MSKAKNLIIPSALAVAVIGGFSGGALLNSLGASADTSSTASTATSSPTNAPPDPSRGGHTANGITETVLTGDTLAKATAAAEKAEPSATVVRAETDAEGAKYEVHMKQSDGSMVTVKLDASFNVTSTENGMK